MRLILHYTGVKVKITSLITKPNQQSAVQPSLLSEGSKEGNLFSLTMKLTSGTDASSQVFLPPPATTLFFCLKSEGCVRRRFLSLYTLDEILKSHFSFFFAGEATVSV